MATSIPLIDRERCTGCGACVAQCPTQALGLRDGKADVIDPEACVYCPNCEMICPAEAIGRPFEIRFGPAVVQQPR